ncbi:MAG: hypothetical protein ACI9T7_000025 [Oleiphilaceae bacterium]|jgi:hypothetical protein
MSENIDLERLYKLRRNFEVRLLKVERLIAEKNQSSLKSIIGLSQKEVDMLLCMNIIDLDKINDLGHKSAIYTIADYNTLERLMSSLEDDDQILASLIAETGL